MPRGGFLPRVVFCDLLALIVEMTLKQTSSLSSNFSMLAIAIMLSKSLILQE